MYAQAESTANDSIKNAVIQNWIDDLHEPGVSFVDDSVYISDESRRLMTDEHYRTHIYPAVYTWDVTKYLIQKQQLKKAFWYLINLYLINDQNKELVVRSVLAYDRLFSMDEILINTFYTYCYMDPEIGTMVDGIPEIQAPHIMEKKLRAVKEILQYVKQYNLENEIKEP